MSSTNFYIKVGDRRPVLQDTLVDASGAAINLTTATGVTLIMRPLYSATPKVNAAGTIVTAASGIVQYSWGATDTDTPGDYYREWKITWSTGITQRVPGQGYWFTKVTPNLD